MDKRKTKKLGARVFALSAILVLPSLGLATWYWVVQPPGEQLTRMLRDYGYVAVRPPSRLFGPGTFTTVETLPDGAMQLHLACRMNNDGLAAMWQKSTTLNRRSIVDARQTFDSSANVVEIVKSRAAGKRLKGFDVSLQDISIVTMSHENLIDVRNQYLKGSCEEAVIGNIRAGALVCQPEEVLQADIVYRSESEDRLEGQGERTRGAAAGSANIAQHVSQTDDVHGDDLFLGVRVRLKHCFRLAGDGQRLAVGGF